MKKAYLKHDDEKGFVLCKIMTSEIISQVSVGDGEEVDWDLVDAQGRELGYEVVSGDHGPQYKIVALPDFFLPDIQGRNRPVVVRSDETGAERYFDTLDGAREAKGELESGRYDCRNGEAGRPEYHIVEADFVIGHEDGGNYDWDDCDCTAGEDGEACGECNECLALMIEQDRDMVIAAAIE